MLPPPLPGCSTPLSLFACQWVFGLQPVVFHMTDIDFDANSAPFLARVSSGMDYAFHACSAHESARGMLQLKQAMVMEQLYIERLINNAIMCEGEERVMRPQTMDQWATRLARVGFSPAPLSDVILQAVSQALQPFPEGFSLRASGKGVQLLWCGQPSVFSSSWRCSQH